MVRNVLLKIYESKEITECLKRITRKDLADDIKQYVFLQLFERPESEIQDLHDRGKLKAYIVKMIYNTDRFKDSPFTRQYGFNRNVKEITERDHPIDESDNEEELFQMEQARLIEEFVSEIDRKIEIGVPLNQLPLKPLEVDMVRLYSDHGNFRLVEALTGIPRTTIHRAVQKAKKAIYEFSKRKGASLRAC